MLKWSVVGGQQNVGYVLLRTTMNIQLDCRLDGNKNAVSIKF
jgi:hypothetical protein